MKEEALKMCKIQRVPYLHPKLHLIVDSEQLNALQGVENSLILEPRGQSEG